MERDCSICTHRPPGGWEDDGETNVDAFRNEPCDKCSDVDFGELGCCYKIMPIPLAEFIEEENE